MLPTTAGDALAGLKAMGASEQHQILEEMIAWVQAHPGEAARQQGFQERAAALEALDTRFYEAERLKPMTQLAARWIASWPELHAVAREQFSSEIARLAQLNPHLSQRRIWLSVSHLSDQITDRPQLTIAAACGAVRPDPELKLAVFARNKRDAEGGRGIAIMVQTDKGSRLCVCEAAGGQLYKFGPGSQSPKPEEMHEVVRTYPPTLVGARLSAVEADTILKFARIAQENLAAEAIDLLLRKLDLDPAAMITALRVSDDRATWYAATGNTGVMVETLADRSNVIASDGELLLTATRAEIEHHAADAAVGHQSLQIPA